VKKIVILLTAMLTFTTSALAQIGSADKDLVFTPITPCRILDTRLFGGVAGTPIPAASTYSYAVGGLTSYATLGGSATDCGLLTPGLNIAALAINFVVVSPSAAGYITAYPYLATRPTASTVNYTAGEVVANSAIVKVSQSSSTWMSVYSLATTHLVADVTGYYSKPVATALQCVEMTASETLVVGTSATLGTAVCPAGYSITGGSCGSSLLDQGRLISSKSFGIGTAFQSHSCTFKNEGTSILTFTASAICCRIPGR
jgi:hypothetical protein